MPARCSSGCSCRLKQYLDFLGERASGRLLTPAQWIRQFVAQHPGYQHDSTVSDEVAFDLLKRIQSMSEGDTSGEALLHGDFLRQCAKC